MRLIYLDEAGTSAHEPLAIVAGVIIQGDRQWLNVNDHMLGLIDRYIPLAARENFVFHAKDVFHGTGFFQRELWPREKRWEILGELAKIPAMFDLPIVWGQLDKVTFRKAVEE